MLWKLIYCIRPTNLPTDVIFYVHTQNTQHGLKRNFCCVLCVMILYFSKNEERRTSVRDDDKTKTDWYHKIMFHNMWICCCHCCCSYSTYTCSSHQGRVYGDESFFSTCLCVWEIFVRENFVCTYTRENGREENLLFW